MLVLGLCLFVAGFVVTISGLSQTEAKDLSSGSGGAFLAEDSNDSSRANVLLLSGLLLSISGVVFATAGPAAMFIQREKQGQ